MVKVGDTWYLDQEAERSVYAYLRDRLHVLHDLRAQSDSPDVQTEEEVRVIDLIVQMDMSHIAMPARASQPLEPDTEVRQARGA